MAGHSKWANIKHKKAASDAKRGRVWTRLIKEITVAAKMGGSDLDANARLRLATDKASAANMPKDNVQRAISRGVGGQDGANYESIRYEGYGTNGAAFLVDCLTDNRVRTVSDVRHLFSKYGGNLATEGAVAYQFQNCGQFLFAPQDNEEALFEAALESGAEDVISDDEGGTEIICAVDMFGSVKEALEKAGFEADFADIIMKPQNTVDLDAKSMEKHEKLKDALENLDDVQAVYDNVTPSSE